MAVAGHAADWRRVSEGRLIPDESHCDQPYVVITQDGSWLCTMTTGPGGESQPGQHAVVRISGDQGRTWSPAIDLEPSGPIESSWVVPAVTPGGRVYAFCNYNGDDIRSIPGKTLAHATILGWYVYRTSEDHGRTWSAQRHRPPPHRARVCGRRLQPRRREELDGARAGDLRRRRAAAEELDRLRRGVAHRGREIPAVVSQSR